MPKASKEKNYELPEIPDYERPVLEKPQEFDFGEYVPRDKSKLDRPATQVRTFFLLLARKTISQYNYGFLKGKDELLPCKLVQITNYSYNEFDFNGRLLILD